MDKTFVANLLSSLEEQPEDTVIKHFSLHPEDWDFEVVNISMQTVSIRGLSSTLKTQLNATVNIKTYEVTSCGFTNYEPPK